LSGLSPLLIIVGRAGLASLFVLGGINKLLNYDATLDRMAETDLPLPEAVLPFVIALEVIGGTIVALGRSKHEYFALMLATFTLATNFVFHNFWTMTGATAQLELSLFFKNISIAGALILVAGWSLNRERP